MTTPRLSLSVVIVNFDGEEYLPGMMEALAATGYPFHEIIVCDDASRDGSLLLLRHRYPHVRVIPSDRNRGPGVRRNDGIAAATGDVLLLLDNDGYPFPDAVEPWMALLEENPRLVGVMPRIVLRGDPPTVQCDGAYTHFTGQMGLLRGHQPLEEDGPPPPEPIRSLMGTATVVRREAALALGGFGADFFIYYEDHDFGTRLVMLQGEVSSCPQGAIDHLGGTKNLSFRTGRVYPPRRAYLTCKNRHLFALRTLQGRTMAILAPVFVVHEAAQLAFATLRGWIEPYSTGLFWNVGHLGRTLRQRHEIQSRRRLPDRDLIQSGPLPLHPGVLKETGPAAALRRLLERVLNGLYCVLSRGLSR